MDITLRSRPAAPRQPGGASPPVESRVQWDPKKTAIIICDMWDDHWCKSAARRVVELAVPMNAVVRQARSNGVFIIHAPSSVTEFYRDTPQRRRAQSASFHQTKVPLVTVQRWGTAWCWPDPKREAPLPIDDADMGCDCAVKCPIREAWTRQIDLIAMDEQDAITDHGQETYNLLEERGIHHVILMGVHLNMCVMGRPFGLRQMTRLGKDVVLMRDMTDTMYDPRSRPKVSHFEGTDLVIAHVEKYWCPTMTSADITGRAPFRFRDDHRHPSR